ncbi:hypothetical protein BDZ89DRAFT_1161019 [Hymenopellis radicata]|nr:hypothetical protein BDZ89DRAFT_1161019 [Hymenopellis radicata]
MGLHFFDKSPSWPSEQLARLGPSTALLQAGIPCVVWTEVQDSLSIVDRVPTSVFDTQLLVSAGNLHCAASQTICSKLPYAMENDNALAWKELVLFNKDRPHAFDIGAPLDSCAITILSGREMAERILLLAASIFHFDVHNPSSTCLNPEPPSVESREVRFPTLAAFYDALIATQVYPPRPVYGIPQRVCEIRTGVPGAQTRW